MQAQAIKQEIRGSSLPSRVPSLLNGWHGVPDISTSATGRGCSPQQGQELTSGKLCSLVFKISNPGKFDPAAGHGLKLLNTSFWMCEGAHARCCKIPWQAKLSSQAETETKLPPKASGSLDAWVKHEKISNNKSWGFVCCKFQKIKIANKKTADWKKIKFNWQKKSWKWRQVCNKSLA